MFELTRRGEGRQPGLAASDQEFVDRHQSIGWRDVQAADRDFDLDIANERTTASAGRAKAPGAIGAGHSACFERVTRPYGIGMKGRSTRLAAILAVAKADPYRFAGHMDPDAPAQATATARDFRHRCSSRCCLHHRIAARTGRKCPDRWL